MIASTQRAFAVDWSSLGRWVLPAAASATQEVPANWRRVRISELVTQYSERTKVEANTRYKMAGVRWYGEGVFHRETCLGGDLSATFITRLIPGAVIYNRLFAWKASFAVVPAELGNCFVSNEFPQFIVDEGFVDPTYLYLFCIRETTIRIVNAASIGSAAVSRHRFTENEFMLLEMLLPPLEEQQRVVTFWTKARFALNAIKQRAEQARGETEKRFLTDLGLESLDSPRIKKGSRAFAASFDEMYGWSVRATLLSFESRSIAAGKYPILLGAECISEVRHGCSASPSPVPTELGVLKISAVTRGEFAPEERKFAVDEERIRKDFDLRKGDVLLCRTNGTLGYVGMSALVRQEMPNLIFPDKIIRVRTEANIVPEYLWLALQTHPLRAQIEIAARTAVGNYAIGTEDIWNLKIPVPPVSEQKRIVAQSEVARVELLEHLRAADDLQRALGDTLDAAISGRPWNESLLLGS